jgi:hypothetical protein
MHNNNCNGTAKYQHCFKSIIAQKYSGIEGDRISCDRFAEQFFIVQKCMCKKAATCQHQ